MSSTQPSPNLYTALLAAQGDFSAIVKNKQNPHLKNFYADLGAVLDAVVEPLARHGLLIVQRFGHDQGGPILITEIVHAESGQSIASELPVVCKDPTDPQKLGGAITYARRYSLLAILSLTAEDDDGNAASKPAPPRQQPQRPRPEPLNAAPVGSPYDDAEYQRLSRQVRVNDEALSGDEYRRYDELSRIAKEQRRTTPAPPAPAPQPTGTPAPAAKPPLSPAITREVDWTDVWSTARPMGIKDRAALDQWLGGDGAKGLQPWQILARLREAAPAATPASYAG